ncbi:MAG: carbon-nitrogen hydrolase family protein [Syntrophomonadaceae bacterium]|mgnify:CR=1 FL=1|nr:carbon-nitrogen hydrolase family protein [Syntrophomonadaceae bacterium]
MHNIKVAVIQMSVSDVKETNLKKAQSMIKKACQQGAQMVVLPEVFNSPYQTDLFPDYAEPYPGPTTRLLSQLAAEHEILLVGGSIIEKDADGKLYNSSFVFDEKGQLLGQHRKVHLFDINLSGKITFRESDTLHSGNSITVIRHQGLCFSIMICYDFRFPELVRAAVLEGAQLLVVPAAFTVTTGEAHWELLMRSRAVDNQSFVIAASPARNPESSYQAWGHSMVVDPWGQIIAEAGEDEGIIYVELDLKQVDQIRQQLPLLQHRRHDLYKLNYGRLME